MTITKSTPYTKEEIEKLSEQFEIYIKTVIDVKRKICSAGCDLHIDSEQILLKGGSKQDDIWGGGINLDTKDIDFNSMINIRPTAGNMSTEIQSAEIRKIYEDLTRYFFKIFYE